MYEINYSAKPVIVGVIRSEVIIKRWYFYHEPRKISCSRFLAQTIDSTARPKNVRLT